MSARHTPGPWAVEDPIFQQLTIVEANKQTYEWRFIASVDLVSDPEDGRPISVAEAKANARLIAAAPDLLSIACRWAAIDGGAWAVERHDREKAELLADTRAAIAKATAA